MTLLRVLSAYERVLERRGIIAIEDTRQYQLLLQLSLLPQHDWYEKLAAFKPFSRGGGRHATAAQAPPPSPPGKRDPSSLLAEAAVADVTSAASSLRAAAASLRAVSPTHPPPSPTSHAGFQHPQHPQHPQLSALRPALRRPSEDDGGSTGPGVPPSPVATAHPPAHATASSRYPSYEALYEAPYDAGRGTAARRGAPSPASSRARPSYLPPGSPAAAPPTVAGGFAADATAHSEWWEAFLSSSVGSLDVDAAERHAAVTPASLRQRNPPPSPGLGSAAFADERGSRPPSGFGYAADQFTYAGNGQYVLSEVYPRSDETRPPEPQTPPPPPSSNASPRGRASHERPMSVT